MNNKYVNDRISVIIPVFNAEKYIGHALESVFVQTYKNIEVVLVDDCSKDASVNIIERYQKKYPGIIYFRQEINMGAGAARNKALELASGRYVAFLDSDDLWLPGKIEKQLLIIKKKNTPFSYTAIEMINEEGIRIKPKRKIKESCNYAYLLHNTIIATSSVVIDRDFFGDFRMSLRREGQDYATWLMLLRGGVVAYGVNEALVKYRVRSGSLSSNKFKSIKQVWDIQTKDEKIDKTSAMIYAGCFAFNAFKKYFI